MKRIVFGGITVSTRRKPISLLAVPKENPLQE
ncbi:hypothetical protein J2S11_001646 [Bacillus horti]|uniref:Uncharacterized protein n=1 Tax=Caldalkalibacillus horti TaxID=77523 RepID=A0ABT9VXM0_9BACI|nr:hypothetical protein [Bacillus horti]